MKRSSIFLLTFAALGVVAAVGLQMRSRHLRAELDRERQQFLLQTQEAQTEHAKTKRQVQAARAQVAAAERRTATPAAPATATPAHETTVHAPAVATALDPEMRQLRVQTFASEQRMQFAALLHHLDFTPAQRQAFDRIQETFAAATLDERLDASGREQAREARAAALRDLFGPHHDAWLEASRQQPARAIVDQIVQQTFASSGALNAPQAEELTRIVDQYRSPASGAGGPASYDWDRIIGEARTILADRQMDDFITAVSHRRASDQMAAMAAAAKR